MRQPGPYAVLTMPSPVPDYVVTRKRVKNLHITLQASGVSGDMGRAMRYPWASSHRRSARVRQV